MHATINPVPENDTVQKQEKEIHHSQSKNTVKRLTILDSIYISKFSNSQEINQNQNVKHLLKNGNMRLNASERRKRIQI